MITPAALNNLAWQAYLIFMCTNLAFIPLVYFCYPETSNLTLEEVDHLFITHTPDSGHAGDGDAGKLDVVKKIAHPSDPVQVSIEKHHEHEDMEKGKMATMGGLHVEHAEDVSPTTGSGDSFDEKNGGK